jgi:hypothetical protein
VELTALFADFPRKAQESLSRDPSNLEEALVRIVVALGNQWMAGAEPLSTEVDRLLGFWIPTLRWDERAAAKLALHQLKKVREANLASKEG